MRITEQVDVGQLGAGPGTASFRAARTLVLRTQPPAPAPDAAGDLWTPTFDSCGTERRSLPSTVSVSLAVHAGLVAAAILVPLFLWSPLPPPGDSVHAFFVSPAAVPPPPPPPPPPAPASVSRLTKKAAPTPVPDSSRMVAPVVIPDEVVPEKSADLGVDGGVVGGVEGGVAGGIVGAVVGGLPSAPPPPPRMVRVGGQVKEPKLVRKVKPDYPVLAEASRVTAIVILDAEVDAHGAVREVRVLRGHPLFDEAAVAAVRQWIYQPLLLNGQPSPFVVTVTMVFNIKPRSE